MVSVYKYISSKDVRKHLCQIGYTFSPAERAYIVGTSHLCNLRAKKVEYEEILRTTPDCLVGENSLHDFLRGRLEDYEDPMHRRAMREAFQAFFSPLPLQFPLPFEKGDILVNPFVIRPEPFVFSGEHTDFIETEGGARLKGYISGFNYGDWGAVMTVYQRALECERYTVEKKEYVFPQEEKNDATLFLLSAYLKGKIDEEACRDHYKQLAVKIAEAEMDNFFEGKY